MLGASLPITNCSYLHLHYETIVPTKSCVYRNKFTANSKWVPMKWKVNMNLISLAWFWRVHAWDGWRGQRSYYHRLKIEGNIRLTKLHVHAWLPCRQACETFGMDYVYFLWPHSRTNTRKLACIIHFVSWSDSLSLFFLQLLGNEWTTYPMKV